MVLDEDLAEGGTSSPGASTSQVPQAAPLDTSEHLTCPICGGTINDKASVSSCRHTFCFYCIMEWCRSTAECPICKLPFHHICRKVGDSNFEMYRIVQYNSSTSHTQGRRSRPRSAGRSQHHSPARQHHRSSGRDHGGARTRASERGGRTSLRRRRDGHSRAQHAQGYHHSSSRRQQQSRAQNTAHDGGQAPRLEWDAMASSRRSELRQRGGRVSFREQQATRSRSRRRSHSTWRRTQGQ